MWPSWWNSFSRVLKSFKRVWKPYKRVCVFPIPPFNQEDHIYPFTRKSDRFQISPAASPEVLHYTVWRTWLLIAYSDKRPHIYYTYIIFSLLGECRPRHGCKPCWKKLIIIGVENLVPTVSSSVMGRMRIHFPTDRSASTSKFRVLFAGPFG